MFLIPLLLTFSIGGIDVSGRSEIPLSTTMWMGAFIERVGAVPIIVALMVARFCTVVSVGLRMVGSIAVITMISAVILAATVPILSHSLALKGVPLWLLPLLARVMILPIGRATPIT
jgi:hypothetical protein